VHGDRWGMLSQLYKIPEGHHIEGLHGVISTFSKLDPALPWFNEKTTDDASDLDLGEIKLPAYLQPNHQRCHFVFDTVHHVVVFESLPRKGGISARTMRTFLERLFENDRIREKFSNIKITVIPDARTVREILAWTGIRTLVIRVTKPNPGDYSEEDFEEIERRLEEQNADRLEERLHAEEGKALKPSEATQILAKVAEDNGYVEAEGQGRKLSTRSSKPLVEKTTYDSDVETHTDSLLRAVGHVIADIAGRRRARVRRDQ
jgi:hypothetical protein